jgi:hypothetical protein
MNKKICNKASISVALAVFALSSLIVSVEAKKNDFKFYHNGIAVPGSGECFADQANGDFLSSESCFSYTSVASVKKENKEKDKAVINSTIPTIPAVENTPVPTPKVIPTKENTPVIPENTPTPKPEKTPVPTKECKNKNQYKNDNSVDCNAGLGNG